MSITDQAHLAHLAAQAVEAQASRQKQERLAQEARDEAARQRGITTLGEQFKDLFGARLTSELGVRFCWDERFRRPIALYVSDGAERGMYFENYGLGIYIPGEWCRAGLGYYGDLPSRLAPAADTPEERERQRVRADALIIALAKTFEKPEVPDAQ
jgi:hypothetical protein